MMAKLVSTLSQAQTNIRRFRAEVDSDPDMRARLAYNRAWYAEAKPGGGWEVGPSKFIGYDGMTAAAYDPKGLNGRETERQLAQWYTQLHSSDALFAEIDRALRAFLAHYNKTPSSLYRINVSNDQYEAMTNGNADGDDTKIGDLLIAVGRKLIPAERGRVKAAL